MSEKMEIEFCKRAIKISKACQNEDGRVHPKVGALASKDGKILGDAYRGEMTPGEHAEFTLLERKYKEEKFHGATIYTTLEPCAHRGDKKIACA